MREATLSQAGAPPTQQIAGPAVRSVNPKIHCSLNPYPIADGKDPRDPPGQHRFNSVGEWQKLAKRRFAHSFPVKTILPIEFFRNQAVRKVKRHKVALAP